MALVGDGIAGILKGSAELIKTIHNPAARREAQLAAQKLANEHQVKLEEIGLRRDEFEVEAQTKQQTQEAEATKVALGSRSWWVAGARPAMVWIGALSLGINFVLMPILALFPFLDMSQVRELQLQSEHIWPIISGTGIVAIARSHDKAKKVADQ